MMEVLRRCGGYHLHERTGYGCLGFKACDAMVMNNMKTIAITIDEKTLEMLDELKRSEALTAAMVAALPPAAAQHKHLINPLATWLVTFADHHREHFAEIRGLIEAARK